MRSTETLSKPACRAPRHGRDGLAGRVAAGQQGKLIVAQALDAEAEPVDSRLPPDGEALRRGVAGVRLSRNLRVLLDAKGAADGVEDAGELGGR